MTIGQSTTNIDRVVNYPIRKKEYLKAQVELIIDGVNVLETEEDRAMFRDLIFRGSNTWNSKPRFIRKLSSLVQHGECLFDYDRMPEREFKHTTEGIQYAAAQQAQRDEE